MSLITIYTEIDPALKQKRLWISTLLSGLGASLLIGFGAFSSLSFLSSWGLLIFLFSLFLIAVGYLPYQKLAAVDAMPNSLSLTEKGELRYRSERYQELVIPIDEIASLTYEEGIALTLKSGRKLLFPYFSEKSFRKLITTTSISTQYPI